MGIVDYKDAIDVVDENGNDISVIYINGVPFKGISRDSSLGWEEFVWSEEPTRSNSFAFENMDDIDIGLVAQCQVNFKYFNIQDFMKFREAIKQRHFMVKFFNVDTGSWMTREMYCSKSQRDKLYYFNPKLIGVLDFTINLVATNRDVIDRPNIIVKYNTNGGVGFIPDNYNIERKTEDVIYGNEFYPTDGTNSDGNPLITKTGYALKSWNTMPDGSGWTYNLGTGSFTAFKDVTLYAIWE